jgi:hypothetical protein
VHQPLAMVREEALMTVAALATWMVLLASAATPDQTLKVGLGKVGTVAIPNSCSPLVQEDLLLELGRPAEAAAAHGAQPEPVSRAAPQTSCARIRHARARRRCAR